MFAWIHNPDAFDNSRIVEEIYQKYKKLMFSTARKFTQNILDQEDIVQTALEKLIKIFSNLDPSDCCITASYIVYTVRSVSIDFLRKWGRESEILISMGDIQDAELGQIQIGALDDLLVSLDRSERLNYLWTKVPAKTRILLEGKYIYRLSDKELAIIVGCKPSAVRMKLTRARRQAAKILSERDE